MASELRDDLNLDDTQGLDSDDGDSFMGIEIEPESHAATASQAVASTDTPRVSKQQGVSKALSLADLESSINAHLDTGNEEPDQSAETGGRGAAPTSERNSAPQTGLKQIIYNKAVWAAVGSVFLIIIAHLAFTPATPKPAAPKATTMIRHPVVIQQYQEQLDFLVLTNAQQGKELLSMDLKFGFPALNTYEDFLRQDVTYRAAVYQFLRTQQTAGGSREEWQEIVEKALLSHLKTAFPRCGIQSIRLGRLNPL